MPLTEFKGTGGNAEVEVIFEIQDDFHVQLDCSYQAPGSSLEIGLHETNATAWDFILDAPDFEIVNMSPPQFKLSDWDVVNEGDIYARRIVEQVVDPGFYQDTEKTTFELIHLPK